MASHDPVVSRTAFDALVRAITYQQMSDAAAAKTYKGLQLSLETALTPERVLALPHDMMRAVGLSKSKARYVQNLAEWFNANSDTAKNLQAMSNDEVIKTLTDIAGIGVWTANVFCYSICRGSTSCRPRSWNSSRCSVGLWAQEPPHA